MSAQVDFFYKAKCKVVRRIICFKLYLEVSGILPTNATKKKSGYCHFYLDSFVHSGSYNTLKSMTFSCTFGYSQMDENGIG